MTMAIKKIKLPNNTTQDVNDARIDSITPITEAEINAICV